MRVHVHTKFCFLCVLTFLFHQCNHCHGDEHHQHNGHHHADHKNAHSDLQISEAPYVRGATLSPESKSPDGEALEEEQRYYIQELFKRYGQKDRLDYQGFQSLLFSLGLGEVKVVDVEHEDLGHDHVAHLDILDVQEGLHSHSPTSDGKSHGHNHGHGHGHTHHRSVSQADHDHNQDENGHEHSDSHDHDHDHAHDKEHTHEQAQVQSNHKDLSSKPHSDHDHSDHSDHDHSDHSDHDHSDHGDHDHTHQNHSDHDHSGHDHSGHDHSDHDHTIMKTITPIKRAQPFLPSTSNTPPN
ncbi:zinc transporter ZIP10-like [Scomber japonicus]|uniref:zinc transporter ZIP10-like n=1 Tax=Scomber japonicus TaxID=13676 RepID=UPI002305541F|nr:zinc transporter ZIP10-like [Scomber japonicus]